MMSPDKDLAQLVREGSPVVVQGWGGGLLNMKTMAGSYGMADGQGLALAMASKTTVENMLGGITIAFDRPFKVGDTIKIGDMVGGVEDHVHCLLSLSKNHALRKIVEEVKKKEGAFGYNAASEKFEDLLEAGIIDPTKVTRTALENASSVAALLLMTEGVVADKPEKEPPMPPAPPGGGMGGMY